MARRNIYLSLRDALALALENNLDIETHASTCLKRRPTCCEPALATCSPMFQQHRYGPSSAGSACWPARGGSAPPAAEAAVPAAASRACSADERAVGGFRHPSLDPVFLYAGFVFAFHAAAYQHFLSPHELPGDFAKGLDQRHSKGIPHRHHGDAGSEQHVWLLAESPNNDFNPTTNANLSLSITQNLLKSFRPSVNNRVIRVAKNQLKISDLTFQQQITTRLPMW